MRLSSHYSSYLGKKRTFNIPYIINNKNLSKIISPKVITILPLTLTFFLGEGVKSVTIFEKVIFCIKT